MHELPIEDITGHGSCVRRVPVFAGLSVAEQQVVGGFARPRHVAAGELLANAGDPVGHLYVVHTGSLKLLRTTASGRPRLVRVAGAGDVVGEYAFLTGSRPEHSIEAATDTDLCTFAHPDLAALVARYPAIATGIMRSLSVRLDDAERRLALAAVDVPARVAAYLVELPGTRVDGRVVVRLPWPKKDVASWLATTPESFSRALGRLQTRGVIAVHDDVVTLLDIDALETAAGQ